MAARLTRSIASAACLAFVLLGAEACGDAHEATGVQLTIRYETPPALLHIAGSTEDGRRFFGPSIVPDPPRMLAPHRETVLLALPEEMDGSVLSLSVTGLNAQRAPLMRGFVRTEVVRHSIQAAFVSLATDIVSYGDAGVPWPDLDPILDAGTDAAVCATEDCLEPKSIDAATPEPHDAAIQEPEPQPQDAAMQEPEPDANTPCASPLCPMMPACTEQDVCDVKCPGEGMCAIACGTVRDCKPGCKNATCDVQCESAERCQPACEGHADCEITCPDAAACREVTCKDDASCLLRCAGDDCNLRCRRQEDRKLCPGNIIVCNRECP